MKIPTLSEMEANETTFLIASETDSDGGSPHSSRRSQRSRQRSSTIARRSFPVAFLAIFVALLFMIKSLPGPSTDEILLLGKPKKRHAKKARDANVPQPTSFADLAGSLLGVWFNNTVHTVDTVFTETVMPIETAQPRKVILMTRDLLDIFSPVYEGKLWYTLRRSLDVGYETVGHFLDLDHASINYTEASLEALRDDVLEWKASFTALLDQDQEEIFEYLQHPTHHKSVSHKESHLFWMGVKRLPKVGSPATEALATLGHAQANLALTYLAETMKFKSILANHTHKEALERQETFHSLRKTLRSMCDEYDLLGSNMYPDSDKMQAIFTQLKQARTLLGATNDQWTAMDFYRDNNQQNEERHDLEPEIDASFHDLQEWANQTDLKGSLEFIRDTLSAKKSNLRKPDGDGLRNYMPFLSFVQERKRRPNTEIVIGNEAGDADSVVSAISLAYIESPLTAKTPIISIPQAELKMRPETVLLLQLTGLEDPTQSFLFVDSPFLANHAKPFNVTLTDHNEIDGDYPGWQVVEIIDHHEDAHKYNNSSPRRVAFADGKALVASACTLVAERMMELWEPPYPARVSLLLLGVILLDSVNLDPAAGKVTDRDRTVVQELLDKASWGKLPILSREAIGMKPGMTAPNTNSLFSLLQDAKYDPSFWSSMSVLDALEYDYKDFESSTGTFGIASVLTSLSGFLFKPNLIVETYDFMDRNDVSVLAVMLAYQTDGQLNRQLAVFVKGDSRQEPHPDQLVDFLKSSELQLTAIQYHDIEYDALRTNLKSYFFDQGNVAPSRKQIGPLLQSYFGDPDA